MSNDFSIGGGGGGAKARALPKGTRVRIAEMAFTVSRIFPKKKKQDGTEAPNVQLEVVLETLGDGQTVAYKTKTGTVESRPFEAGERFTQYLGGVWQKDGGGYQISDKNGGGAFLFLKALQDQGVTINGSFESLKGIEFAVEHVRTSGPAGSGVRIEPAEGSVVLPNAQRPAASTMTTTAPTSPATTKKTLKPTSPVAPTPPATPATPPATNAFMRLPADDQQLLLDTIEAGQSIQASDLTGAGVAKDLEHANQILAALPKVAPQKVA